MWSSVFVSRGLYYSNLKLLFDHDSIWLCVGMTLTTAIDIICLPPSPSPIHPSQLKSPSVAGAGRISLSGFFFFFFYADFLLCCLCHCSNPLRISRTTFSCSPRVMSTILVGTFPPGSPHTMVMI